MSNIKDLTIEMMCDFSLSVPRVLVSGDTGIIDNIKKVVMVTEKQVIVNNGSKFTSIYGQNLIIKQLGDERMLIKGEFEGIQFYGTLPKD